jgi:hypothetical protein
VTIGLLLIGSSVFVAVTSLAIGFVVEIVPDLGVHAYVKSTKQIIATMKLIERRILLYILFPYLATQRCALTVAAAGMDSAWKQKKLFFRLLVLPKPLF